MSFSVFFCLLTLVLGFGVSLRSGRSAALRGLIFAEAVLALYFLVAYVSADFFTGEGINAATLFHVRYGFEGAGVREYRGVILSALATLLIAPLVIGILGHCRRNQPHLTVPLFAGQLLLLSAHAFNPAVANFVTLSSNPAPATADFLRHYHRPTITPVSSRHPNVVFIYAESLERTYFDETRFPGLITELRALEAEGTSFTNIHTVHGTGFTMGGIVGSLCGIPLFTPSHANSMSGMDSFLPGAKGLSDLLKEQGYRLSFMGGASLDFAGKGKFFKTHGFDEVSGFQQLHPQVPDQAYLNNWGIYDDTLFDLAYARFLALAGQKNPFGLFILTLDTHHPQGHVSKSAPRQSYGDGRNPVLNAVAAFDSLIGQFVRRIRASAAGRDTVIVITSDHLAMQNSASEQLKQGERRNLFLVLDPQEAAGGRIERQGSTLDVGVTLLSSLGFSGRIGAGRDLRDPTIPEAERAHIQQTATLLSWRPELAKFWDFPRLRQSLTLSADAESVTIDGRAFRAPVLVELERDGRTTLRFEFDAAGDARLAQQAEALGAGRRFLLVVKTEDASPFAVEPAPAGGAPWVLVVGQAGSGHTTAPLTPGATFSREAIESMLTRATDPNRSAPLATE